MGCRCLVHGIFWGFVSCGVQVAAFKGLQSVRSINGRSSSNHENMRAVVMSVSISDNSCG